MYGLPDRAIIDHKSLIHPTGKNLFKMAQALEKTSVKMSGSLDIIWNLCKFKIQL
jgi:hypothetical protein